MNTTAEKIANPLNFYQHPNEVEGDSELSIDDKIKLLENWLDDIKLRQIAEEENMPPPEETRYYLGDVEALLQKYKIELLGDG
jgi:hypothetical protein